VTTPLALAAPLTDGGMDLDSIRRATGPKATQAAAKELEVVFLSQLIQAMKKTIPKNDFLPEAPSRETFDGVFDRTMASAIAERDPLGLVAKLSGPGLKESANSADTMKGRESHED